MKAKIDNIEFRIEQDTIDATPSQEPDPNWQHRDKAGHLHLWRFINGKPDFVSSLKNIQDAAATEDHPAVSHHECRQCGEHVEPGYRSVNTRKEITGLRTYFINDEEVSEKKYKKLFYEVQKRCG